MLLVEGLKIIGAEMGGINPVAGQDCIHSRIIQIDLFMRVNGRKVGRVTRNGVDNTPLASVIHGDRGGRYAT